MVLDRTHHYENRFRGLIQNEMWSQWVTVSPTGSGFEADEFIETLDKWCSEAGGLFQP